MCEDNSNKNVKLVIKMLIVFFIVDCIICLYMFNRLHPAQKEDTTSKTQIENTVQQDAAPAEINE